MKQFLVKNYLKSDLFYNLRPAVQLCAVAAAAPAMLLVIIIFRLRETHDLPNASGRHIIGVLGRIQEYWHLRKNLFHPSLDNVLNSLSSLNEIVSSIGQVKNSPVL